MANYVIDYNLYYRERNQAEINDFDLLEYNNC